MTITFKLGRSSFPIRMQEAWENELQFDNAEQISTSWIR